MKNPPSRVRIAVASCLFACCSIAHALDVLRNPNDDPALGDAVPYEGFGSSVAVDGTTIAIGSIQGRRADGVTTGAVRVYVKKDGAWSLQQKLVAPDAESWDEFGATVALEGDTLVVGAPNRTRLARYHRGGAYVFERSGGAWSCVQTLDGPDASFAFFGSAVALANGRVAIGAPETPVDSESRAGSVSVFARDASGWRATQTLSTPFKSGSREFGAAVAFGGGELFVGSPGDDDDRGAVYEYALDGAEFRFRRKLASALAAPADRLGLSLASDGARLLAGAPDADGGKGYVADWRLKDGVWLEHDRWLAANDADVHGFGERLARQGARWLAGGERGPDRWTTTSVEIDELGATTAAVAYRVPYEPALWYGGTLSALAASDDEVFVGLPTRYVAPWSAAGEVRVFGANGGDYALEAGVTANEERFGEAVAANADWIFVGAPGEHRFSAISGAVFAYDRRAPSAAPAVLTEPDGALRDGFGGALALSGGTLLVGAPGDDAYRGSVRLYEYDGATWAPTERWPEPADGVAFGATLAADPTAAIVASRWESSAPGVAAGVAYVYERSGAGWLPPVRLVSRLVESSDDFGASVAIDGNVAVVGRLRITGDEQTGPVAVDGAAHVFERSSLGWHETVYMERPLSEEPNGEFGASVAIDGDTIFVGAPLLGEVHVWRRGTFNWQWIQRIAAPADGSQRFGARLRVADHELWVSASAPYPIGRTGLYRYRRVGDEWRLARSIVPDGRDEMPAFAQDFAVAGRNVFVGTPQRPGYAPFVRDAGGVRIDEAGLFDGGFED